MLLAEICEVCKFVQKNALKSYSNHLKHMAIIHFFLTHIAFYASKHFQEHLEL